MNEEQQMRFFDVLSDYQELADMLPEGSRLLRLVNDKFLVLVSELASRPGGEREGEAHAAPARPLAALPH